MAAEQKRGCGYRKIGGLYLVGDGPTNSCDRLPFELSICPTCHGGIKQTRGWTWLDAPELLGHAHTYDSGNTVCAEVTVCAVCNPDHYLGEEFSAGLLWIGTQFYKTPADFLSEAREMGVSRRITALPRNFKMGETWVLFAHPKAIRLPCDRTQPLDEGNISDEYKPGIFQAFKPSRVEKILGDDSTQEERDSWTKKGYTVVTLPADDKDHQGDVYARGQ